jgi:ribosomal protein S8
MSSSEIAKNLNISRIEEWDDLELCLTYQSGLEKSLVILMERYRRAIYKYAHQLKRKLPSSLRYTFEECENEVLIALIESLKKFDLSRLEEGKSYNIRTLWEKEIGTFNHNKGWAYVSSKKREHLRTEQDNLEDFESNKKRKSDQMSFKASNKILDVLIQKEFVDEWRSLLVDVEKTVFDVLLQMRKPKLARACKIVGAPKFVKKSMRQKYYQVLHRHQGSAIN